jgi:hypothetical protein
MKGDPTGIQATQENTMIALVLNSRHPLLPKNTNIDQMEHITRNWIFHTYRKRLRLLSTPVPPGLK